MVFGSFCSWIQNIGKWDALVIKLEVIEEGCGQWLSEVLHWVTHFPVSIVPLVLL